MSEVEKKETKKVDKKDSPAEKKEDKKVSTKKEEKKPAAKKASKVKTEIKAVHYDTIIRPIVTEKSQIASEFGAMHFMVDVNATKKQIKDAVEALWGVEVKKVNVINVKGKVKRFRGTIGKRKDTKKAIVTLAQGNEIDITAVA